MINIKTLKGLHEYELSQIEHICHIFGEYNKDYLQVVYHKTNDGEITGCLLYQNRFPDISNIFYLSVKKQFQNQGIATKIIELYKKVSRPITLMCIPESSPVISFFSKHLFKIMTKQDFLKYNMNIICDEDDIVMMYKK